VAGRPVARWGYANLHFRGIASHGDPLFRLSRELRVRCNTVFVAMAISVIGYALYPTAPPRFLPELGLDPSSAVTGNDPLLSSREIPAGLRGRAVHTWGSR
jgi:hypothetical protein